MPRDLERQKRLALALSVAAFTILFPTDSFARKPPTAVCHAQPGEVTEGEPITLSVTGANFNSGHSLLYLWTTTGGKLGASDTQSASISTAGVAAGSYTANVTITDPKQKKNNSATCAAKFTVNAKLNPPKVSCTASPLFAQVGGPVKITSAVSSPDGSPITSVSYHASAGHVTGSGNTATEDTTGVSPGPVTVTVSATDARNLTGTGNCSFTLEAPPPPPQVTHVASVQFPDPQRPWHVDSTAEAILGEVAIRLKSDPNARIAIVGYAGAQKAAGTADVAAQRAVNAKAYLVQQQGIDPGRIEVHKASGTGDLAEIDWIPQGADVLGAPLLRDTSKINEAVTRPREGH